MLTTIVVPLIECCDRWDAPGLSNDSEFPAFALVLFLCLVLLLSRLVAIAAMTIHRIRLDERLALQGMKNSAVTEPCFLFVIPPLPHVPLRI